MWLYYFVLLTPGNLSLVKINSENLMNAILESLGFS